MIFRATFLDPCPHTFLSRTLVFISPSLWHLFYPFTFFFPLVNLVFFPFSSSIPQITSADIRYRRGRIFQYSADSSLAPDDPHLRNSCCGQGSGEKGDVAPRQQRHSGHETSHLFCSCYIKLNVFN